ncbi:26S proteasome non-ATPase regulatory subunit 7-like [Oscarella lobularis]|uniref:26S proteasome non-ATPase regulatory subunit 7-like n=1 Tax=Oscarella lobularis TaxID=121494 RepID=UPI003313E8D4
MPVHPDRVVVHPTVLLSVVDHFNRMAKVGSQKRVVGILLGSWRKGLLDVSNCFAVPFDEDDRDSSVWFLDHNYLENMYAMFRKVNAREKVVGWYHTGPKLHRNDVEIDTFLRQYAPNSVLVIIDAQPKEVGLPTDAYVVVEEVHDDGTPTTKTFEHVTSEIGAEEAEEVGVEHLLRDIKDMSIGTLSQRIAIQVASLKGLLDRLQGIQAYLSRVCRRELPVNHQIMYHLQDIFNLLPNVSIEEFARTMSIKTNDQLMIVYLASLVRSIIALHNLISNKVAYKEAEMEGSGAVTTSSEKEKEKKEKETADVRPATSASQSGKKS